jgi:hypothetical protein
LGCEFLAWGGPQCAKACKDHKDIVNIFSGAWKCITGIQWSDVTIDNVHWWSRKVLIIGEGHRSAQRYCKGQEDVVKCPKQSLMMSEA